MAGQVEWVAVDWGTSNLRAWGMDGEGEIAFSRSSPDGMGRLSREQYPDVLTGLLGSEADGVSEVVICGMAGARQGWIEAPYLDAPADLRTLANGAVWPDMPGELDPRILPGVCMRDVGAEDVMRGEETQLLGAVAPDETGVLAVLPGTHSKWARVEHGRIVDFTTFMTGELYAVLIDHSMLGRLAGHEPGRFSREAFSRAVMRGLDEGELSHDLFGARTLALTGALASDDVADWLSGLLIGREIRAAREWALRAGIDPSLVRIIGSDTLVERYDVALGDAGVLAQRASHDAAAVGLWRVASRARLVGP